MEMRLIDAVQPATAEARTSRGIRLSVDGFWNTFATRVAASDTHCTQFEDEAARSGRRIARRASSRRSFAADQDQIDFGQQCQEKNRLELRQLELERQESKATPSHPYRATVSR